MRPVNLIPRDARRGDRMPLRTGGVSYVVIGGLAFVLLAVIALGFTSKQVSDREADIARLTQEEQVITAQAESLRPFAEFRAVQESRTATVASLAQSRFDWDRVLNELALVIPEDVWLVELSGTVNPTVSLEDSTEIAIRDSVAGPALEVVGCAASQDAVAAFVADLEDIDGVTRVGVQSSERPDEIDDASATPAGTAVTSDSGAEDTNGECRTEDFISRFELVVAFDAVPIPETATTAPSVPAPVAPATGDAPVAEAQAQNGAEQATATQQQARTDQATNIIPGG